MRPGGGDGVGDAISEDTSDVDAETMDVWESVSEDVADADTETMGVGEAVSEGIADADTETMGVGEAVSEDIADADTATMRLCWQICCSVGKAVSGCTADGATENTNSSASRMACSLVVNARNSPCV
jgi:hypothetical protein